MEPTIPSLIAAAERGDASASEALFSALYAQLHGLAQRELARRGAAASLGVTTLLHEAYLDMAGRDAAAFPDRARFMGYASRVMRGLIIDNVRSRHALKRGEQFEITSLQTSAVEKVVDEKELTQIGEGASRCVGAHGPAQLGKGAHLPPPQPSQSCALTRRIGTETSSLFCRTRTAFVELTSHAREATWRHLAR